MQFGIGSMLATGRTAPIEAKNSVQRTVKAFESDIALINARAKGLGCSAAEVIHDMCEELRKDAYLRELGESIDLMRANAAQLADFEAEQEAWDSTVADGINEASQG